MPTAINQMAFIIAAGLMILGSIPARAELVIIGAPSIGIDSLTPKQAKKIWLGKSRRIPGGGAVKVVDQENRKVRNEFYLKLTNKKPSQLKAYWARFTFTGKGSAPPKLPDDTTIKQWVTATPGGLSYIDSAALDGSVKVLLKLP